MRTHYGPIRAGHGMYSTPDDPYWIARCGIFGTWSPVSVEAAIEELRALVGNLPALVWMHGPPKLA